MFQNIEKRTDSTRTDAKGNKITTTTYAYNQDWSDKPESCQNPDYRNPSFPTGLPAGEQHFTAKGIKIGKMDKLLLNLGLVDQLIDWKPLDLNPSQVNLKNLPYGLVSTGSRTIGTQKSSWIGHSIGDIRVFYDVVTSADYTAVAKCLSTEEGNVLIPFVGGLKGSLASQGNSNS